jgi:hypothetical protein
MAENGKLLALAGLPPLVTGKVDERNAVVALDWVCEIEFVCCVTVVVCMEATENNFGEIEEAERVPAGAVVLAASRPTQDTWPKEPEDSEQVQ